ncbi:MAG: hypothetical protein KJ065_07665 [Anaerolineae bacterium]|nr:hypothetical protein [Anaerolineae bacterium]
MTLYYEIRVKGHLDKSWADWFEGLAISHKDHGETLLSGPLTDQAALHGLLNRLRGLGIELIAVNPIDDADTNCEEDADE